MTWVPPESMAVTAADPVRSRILYAVMAAVGSVSVAGIGVADVLCVGADTDLKDSLARLQAGITAGGMVVEVVVGPDENAYPETSGAEQINDSDVFDFDISLTIHLGLPLPDGWTSERMASRICAGIYAIAASVEDGAGGWGGRWADPAPGEHSGEPLAQFTTYLGGGSAFAESELRTMCTGLALRVRYQVARGSMETAT